MVIKVAWPASRIRFGFIFDESVIHCHQVLAANLAAAPITQMFSLPIRYEILSTTATGDNIYIGPCCVQVEGPPAKVSGKPRSVGRNTGNALAMTSGTGNVFPLVAIRQKVGWQMYEVLLHRLDIITTGTSDFRWTLMLNPTMAGTAPTYTSFNANSAVEYALPANTNTIVPGSGEGLTLEQGYCFSNTGAQAAIPLRSDDPADYLWRVLGGLTQASVQDVIVLGVQQLQASADTVLGAISWRESF